MPPDRIVHLIGREAEVAIRFGRGGYPGLEANRLFEEYIFPVCSPRLDWQAQGEAWPDWRMWLLAIGAGGVDGTRGIYFSQTDLIIQAALAGQGVALGNTSLVGDDLATGRPVAAVQFVAEGAAGICCFAAWNCVASS